jgi:hypothetical protein
MSSKAKQPQVKLSKEQEEALLTARAAHETLVGGVKEKAAPKGTPKKKAAKPKKKAAPKKPTTKKTTSKPKKAAAKAATKAKAAHREKEVSKITGGKKSLDKNAEMKFRVTFKSGNRWRDAGDYPDLETGMVRFSRLKRSLYRNEVVCITNLENHRAVSADGMLTTTAEDIKYKEDYAPGQVSFPSPQPIPNPKGNGKVHSNKKSSDRPPTVQELFGEDFEETETDYKGADGGERD